MNADHFWSRELQAVARHLEQQSDSIAQMGLQIVATVVTLAFTLAIFPVQSMVNQYSPIVLRYFRSDRWLSAWVALLLLLLILSLVLVIPDPSLWVACTSLGVVLLAFLALLGALRRVLVMVHATEFIVKRLSDDLKAAIADALRQALEGPRTEKFSKFLAGREQASEVGDFSDTPEEREVFVPDDVIDRLKSKILPLEHCAARAVTANDVTTFAAAVEALAGGVISYLTARTSYRSFRDRFLDVAGDSLQHLALLSESQLSPSFGNVVLKSARELAVRSLELDVFGSQKGCNHLHRPLSSVIADSIDRNLASGRHNLAFFGLREYQCFSEATAKKHFKRSAGEATRRLYAFGYEALEKRSWNCGRCALIACCALLSEMLRDPRDLSGSDEPQKQAAIGLQVLLEKCVEFKAPEQIANVLIDPVDGPRVTLLCFCAIYSPGLSGAQTLGRVPVVRCLAHVLTKNQRGFPVAQFGISLQLYQIGLLTLAACQERLLHTIRFSDISLASLESDAEPWLAEVATIIEHGVTAYVELIRHTHLDRLTRSELKATLLGDADRSLFDYTLSLLVLTLHLLGPAGKGSARFVSLVQQLADGLGAAAEPIGTHNRARLHVLARLVETDEPGLADKLLKSTAEAEGGDDSGTATWASLDRPLFGFDDAKFEALGADIFLVRDQLHAARQ